MINSRLDSLANDMRTMSVAMSDMAKNVIEQEAVDRMTNEKIERLAQSIEMLATQVNEVKRDVAELKARPQKQAAAVSNTVRDWIVKGVGVVVTTGTTALVLAVIAKLSGLIK
jgi:archaellum component FlaC